MGHVSSSPKFKKSKKLEVERNRTNRPSFLGLGLIFGTAISGRDMNKIKAAMERCFRISLFGVAVLTLGLTSPSQAQKAKQRTVTIGGQDYILTSRLKKILIGSFYYNFNHTVGTPLLDSTLKRIGRSENPPWTVDIETNGANITAAKLGNPATTGYQVFFANYISSWASATGFPQANRTAVQSYVDSLSGGVFIMHSSGDSRVGGNWPWFYNTAHPVNYIGESSRTTVSAPMYVPPATRAASHPIIDSVKFGASGTSDTFNVSQGEFHQFTKLITAVVPNADLLLNMNGAQCKLNNAGTNCGVATSSYTYGPTTGVPGPYPAAWTFPSKKGTIGYFMEGHDTITMGAMTRPVWDRFFKQFMYWMAGYDTSAAVAIVGSKSILDFSMDPSGISFHPAEVGVLINKPGHHIVTLYDMAGHKIKEERGSKIPIDYNWNEELKSRKGVYVMRVTVPGGFKSRRFFVN